MPVKFPCTKCKKACKEFIKEGQESICCSKCQNWVHFRCTDKHYDTLTNPDFIFTCERCYKTCPICNKLCRKNQKSIQCNICKFQHHINCIHDQPSLFNCEICTSNSAEHLVDQNISLLSDCSNDETTLLHDMSTSLNSTDFEFESEDEDPDSRGLNFDILPFVGNLAAPTRINPNLLNNFLPKRTRVYKYPCLVCHSVCSKNQNCICCTLCDEWVHLKCTDLTVAKFNKYTDKENTEPYYCVNCLYGNDNGGSAEPPDHTSHFVINSISPDNIPTLSPLLEPPTL